MQLSLQPKPALAGGISDYSIRQTSPNMKSSEKGGPRLGNFKMMQPVNSDLMSKILTVLRSATPFTIPFLLMTYPPGIATAADWSLDFISRTK